MRLLNQKWIDLTRGFELVQKLQANLEDEFGRAVDIGYKHKYRRELNEWQKKRRAFFILVALVPLPLVTLCILTFYFREVACVLAWWLLTTLFALLAMGVAGGRYIIQMINGRPIPRRARVASNLTERWWDSLSPKMLITKGKDERREADFLASLFPLLDDEWLAVQNLFLTSQAAQYSDIILAGPSGIWIFDAVDWSGTIGKKNGSWIRMHGNKRPVMLPEQPDNAWVSQKESIQEALKTRLPHLSWIIPLIHGGIVFTNPKIKLEKALIEGNSAPYGLAEAWRERLKNGIPDERMTRDVGLEIMDMLFTSNRPPGAPGGEFSSASDEANRIYSEVAGQLRKHITELVN